MNPGQTTVAPLARYVYAIAEATPALDGLSRIDGTSLEAIHCDGIVAIVSPVDDHRLQAELSSSELWEGSPIADLARTHDVVVQAVFRHSTVVPMRLGTVFRESTELQAWLRSLSSALAAELARLRDHAEWWVRVGRQVPVQPHPTGSSTGVTATPRGAGYLAARRDELAARARDVTEERSQVHETISALSRLADAVQPLSRGSALARAALLIPRAAEQQFTETAHRLASSLGAASLTVEISGPWAPAHFTEITDVADA